MPKSTAPPKGKSNIGDPWFRPGANVRILSKDTPEWEERRRSEMQWKRDHPRPPMPTTIGGWRRNADGHPEAHFAGEEQIAARREADNEPVFTFRVVFDGEARKWAVKIGPAARLLFHSSDDVIRHLRNRSKGERTLVEFYKSPIPIERWLGDEVGDYISSESW